MVHFKIPKLENLQILIPTYTSLHVHKNASMEISHTKTQWFIGYIQQNGYITQSSLS